MSSAFSDFFHCTFNLSILTLAGPKFNRIMDLANSITQSMLSELYFYEVGSV